MPDNAGANAPEQFLLTKAGLEQRERALEALRTESRPQLASQIRRTRLMLTPEEGGATLSWLQADLESADRQITELEKIIANAKVIGEGPVPETVQPGFGVTVRYDDGGDAVLTLVGPLEADLMQNRIGIESPVGRALLDKGVGAKVRADDGAEAVELTVIAIGKSIAADALPSQV